MSLSTSTITYVASDPHLGVGGLGGVQLMAGPPHTLRHSCKKMASLNILKLTILKIFPYTVKCRYNACRYTADSVRTLVCLGPHFLKDDFGGNKKFRGIPTAERRKIKYFYGSQQRSPGPQFRLFSRQHLGWAASSLSCDHTGLTAD